MLFKVASPLQRNHKERNFLRFSKFFYIFFNDFELFFMLFLYFTNNFNFSRQILQKNSKIILKDEFGSKIFQKICKLYPEVSTNIHHPEEKILSNNNNKGFVRKAYPKKNNNLFENQQIFMNSPFFPNNQNFPKYMGEKNNFT